MHTAASSFRVDRSAITAAESAHALELGRNLTWDERLILELYTSSGYRMINGHLRGHRSGWWRSEEEDERMAERIAVLDSLMRPASVELRLLRGMRLKNPLTEGQIVTDPGFISTSADRKIARCFAQKIHEHHSYLIEIDAPKGTPFLPVLGYFRHLTWRRQEHEILLGRGLSMQINSIDLERAMPLVRARILPQVPMAALYDQALAA